VRLLFDRLVIFAKPIADDFPHVYAQVKAAEPVADRFLPYVASGNKS
jgi:hypothetical protein